MPQTYFIKNKCEINTSNSISDASDLNHSANRKVSDYDFMLKKHNAMECENGFLVEIFSIWVYTNGWSVTIKTNL